MVFRGSADRKYHNVDAPFAIDNRKEMMVMPRRKYVSVEIEQDYCPVNYCNNGFKSFKAPYVQLQLNEHLSPGVSSIYDAQRLARISHR